MSVKSLLTREGRAKAFKPFTNPFGVFMAERRKQMNASGRKFAGGWKEVAAELDAEWRVRDLCQSEVAESRV